MKTLVVPIRGFVYGIIFKTADSEGNHGILLTKEFGSLWRSPNKKDYANAREWVDKEIKHINNSNK